jgi:hypothetical protein
MEAIGQQAHSVRTRSPKRQRVEARFSGPLIAPVCLLFLALISIPYYSALGYGLYLLVDVLN